MCRQPSTVAASSTVDNYTQGVALQIDTDDLIDAQGIADLLGLSHRSSVSTYRRRHSDFPTPVIDMGAGRCLLWLRADIEAWVAERRSG